jgi:hypothetical protein
MALYHSYIFFSSLIENGLKDAFFGFLRPFSNRLTLCRPYATEVRRVLPPHQNTLGKLTEGVHKDNHPALIDPAIRNPDNPSELLYEGQLTHGKGSPQNPSYPLHPSKDLEGHARPQNYVPPRTVMYVPEHFFEIKPITGSAAFADQSTVKENT